LDGGSATLVNREAPTRRVGVPLAVMLIGYYASWDLFLTHVGEWCYFRRTGVYSIQTVWDDARMVAVAGGGAALMALAALIVSVRWPLAWVRAAWAFVGAGLALGAYLNVRWTHPGDVWNQRPLLWVGIACIAFGVGYSTVEWMRRRSAQRRVS
jgi:hypothetical protein